MPYKTKEIANAFARKKYHRRQKRLQKYMMAKGCAHCGYNENPLGLEWDHIDSSTKYKAICSMLSSPLKKIFAEIRKCQILCGTCHRIKTRNKQLGNSNEPN